MALSLAVLTVDEHIQNGFLVSINLNKSNCVEQDNKVKSFSFFPSENFLALNSFALTG